MKCIYCGKELGKTTGNKGMLALHVKFKHPEQWKGRLRLDQVGY